MYWHFGPQKASHSAIRYMPLSVESLQVREAICGPVIAGNPFKSTLEAGDLDYSSGGEVRRRRWRQGGAVTQLALEGISLWSMLV